MCFTISNDVIVEGGYGTVLEKLSVIKYRNYRTRQ
jgi:hypothetical protein